MKRVFFLAFVAFGWNSAGASGAADGPPVLDVWPGRTVGRSGEIKRHDRPPRKVIVGTTMTRWYSDYPGLKRSARADARA